MHSRLKDYLLIMTTGLCLCTSLHAAQEHEQYTLLSRSALPLEVQLDPSQRHWIEGKTELILGTSAPDYPPFDLTSSGHDYEGFTADYAGILGKALGLPVRFSVLPPGELQSKRSKTARSTCWAPPTDLRRAMRTSHFPPPTR